MRLTNTKRNTLCPVRIIFRPEKLSGKWHVTATCVDTHNHRPTRLALSTRWLPPTLADDLRHQRVSHRIPVRSLLAQQAELGIFLSNKEARNLIQKSKQEKQKEEGTANMTQTERLINVLDNSADLAYVALYVQSGRQTGRIRSCRTQLKLPESSAPIIQEFGPAALQSVMNGTFQTTSYSVADYLSNIVPDDGVSRDLSGRSTQGNVDTT